MNQGFIKLIIFVIIVAIVLGYFGINIRSIMQSSTVKDNLGYLWDSAKSIWGTYLANPAKFVWGIFYNYIWLSFIENMERLKKGEGPSFMENTPSFEK